MDTECKFKELLKKYQKQVQFEDIELISFEQLGIDQDSPFHLACWRGDIDDVITMIESGVNLNHRGDLNDTPLHYAVRKQREAIIEILLKSGALKDLENDCGDTPLDIAKIDNNEKIIYLLSSK